MQDFSNVLKMSQRVKENISRVFVGKDEIIDLLLISLITGGHILLEDVPGIGKTLLAKSLARSIDCDFKRIQFTPDLLPSDITGIHYYDQHQGGFIFRAGPVFANIVLADELNRATPRTQAALLECMEEQQVTIDGETRKLEHPFLVIATQNPVEIQGTFPLPEAQLDRFLLRLRIGYPDTQEGISILSRFKEGSPLISLSAVGGKPDIIEAQKQYVNVYVHDDLLGYIVNIAEATRVNPEVILGVSPRGTQALLKAAQVRALLKGRSYVIPDDIKALALPVLSHRIILKGSLRLKSGAVDELVKSILDRLPVPSEEIVRLGTT